MTSILALVVSFIVVVMAPGGVLAGPTSFPSGTVIFCVQGTSNGNPWEWAVVDLTTGTPTAAERKTAAAAPMGTGPLTIVNEFVTSATTAPNPPTGATAATSGVQGSCGSGEIELTVNYPNPYSLQVGDPLVPVGSSPVSFNPTIRLLPEPTLGTGLAVGALALLLARRRRR